MILIGRATIVASISKVVGSGAGGDHGAAKADIDWRLRQRVAGAVQHRHLGKDGIRVEGWTVKHQVIGIQSGLLDVRQDASNPSPTDTDEIAVIG